MLKPAGNNIVISWAKEMALAGMFTEFWASSQMAEQRAVEGSRATAQSTLPLTADVEGAPERLVVHLLRCRHHHDAQGLKIGMKEAARTTLLSAG